MGFERFPERLPTTMIRTIYLSRANQAFSHEELEAMCVNFAAANQGRDITGVLLRIGNYFVQVLEGEEVVVNELMRKIRLDSRHGAVTTLLEQPNTQRAFADWSMNLIDCETTYYVNFLKLLELRKQIANMISATHARQEQFSALVLELVNSIRASTSRESVATV
jgi:hypothetical protein